MGDGAASFCRASRVEMARSVIIHSLDIRPAFIYPDEANAPLCIDPDAVAPQQVTLQFLKSVSWQAARKHAFDVANDWNPLQRNFAPPSC